MLTVNRNILEADLCRRSFYDFFLRFWPTIVPEPLVCNWHIKILCDELQTVAERVFARQPKLYDLIINVPPGSTKSTICSEMFPAWCWTRDPTIRTICGSYSYDLSYDLASRFRRILTSDKYIALFPEVELTSEGKENIETGKGGQRIATATMARNATGKHAHFLIIDDPLNPRDAVSDVLLAGANTWFDHTLMSRMVNKALTPLILIMQRLHQNDPTAHRLGKEGVPVRQLCFPAELEGYAQYVRPRSARKYYVGGMFDPVRLPKKVLEMTIKDMGDYAYAGQYGQTPIPAGGGMFRTDQIEIYPSMTGKLVKAVRYWDKAGTHKGGAFTVGCKMGLDRDRSFWILDIVRGQWEANERERIIRQTAIRDSRDVMIAQEQEPGSGGKESAIATLKNLAGFRVAIDRPKGDKVLRADPFSVQVNGGNVKMLKGVWNGEYLKEMQFFPFSTYKDQIDASSGAFAQLTGRLRVGAL